MKALPTLWLVPIVLLGSLMVAQQRGVFENATSASAVRNARSTTSPGQVVPDIAFSADASAYSAVTDRNLFAPLRKPVFPAEPAKQAAEPARPQIRRGVYQLVGTFHLSEGVVAVVKETAGGRSKQVRTGDRLQEYTVKSVKDDQVLLAFADQTEELYLPKYTVSGRAQVAVAPPVQTPPPPPIPVAQPVGGMPPQPSSSPINPAAVPARVSQPPTVSSVPVAQGTRPTVNFTDNQGVQRTLPPQLVDPNYRGP